MALGRIALVSIKGIVREIEKEIAGVMSISLEKAVQNGLLELKAYGGTEQRNLPSEYTQVEYIQGDGNSRIDLNTAINQDDEISIKFSYTGSITGQNVFGGRTSASSQNVMAFFAGTADRFVLDFNNSDYTTYRAIGDVTAGTVYDIVMNKTKRQIKNGDTVVFENTTACADTISLTTAYLFFASGSPAYQTKFTGKIYSCKIAGKVNLIPCKDSNDVVGMYDTINGVFYDNDGTGTFTAGPNATPTPDIPMDIVCNNGVLKARHQSGLPTGYKLLQSIRNNSSATLDTGIQLANTDVVEMRFFNNSDSGYGAWYGIYSGGENTAFYANQTYYGYDGSNNKVNTNVAVDTNGHDIVHDFVNGKLTLDGVDTTFTPFVFTNTINNKLFCRYYGGSYGYNVKGWICYYRVKRNGVLIQNLIPCTRLSDNTVGMYDLVSGTFIGPDEGYTFEEGTAATDPVEIYTDGTTETIESTLSTATAEMLLKLGDSADEQEIITGNVTRKVGIKVLDGTESISTTSSYYQITNVINCDATNRADTICTHYKYGPASNANEFIVLSSGTELIFNIGSFASATGVTTWLASQYAAGTPVIVIYPLATPTTETVAGQTMTIPAGNSDIEITQASLNTLELSAKYKALP